MTNPVSVPRLAIAALLALATAAAAAAAAAAQPSTRPFEVGVCTHFVQRKGHLAENFRMMKAIGVRSIRDEVPWAVVERERGVYVVPERVEDYVNAAIRNQMSVLLPLGYGNPMYGKNAKPKTPGDVQGYANYCAAIARHFKGRVRQYEVWNEYNIAIGVPGKELGVPANYIEMLKVAGPAIKAADPDAIVIGGVVAPLALRDGFFDTLNGLGLARHCDVISVHTYNYGRGAEGRTPEAWLRIMRDVDAVVRKHNGGEPKPLLCTEHGWPTFNAPGTDYAYATTSPQQSADYLARMYLLARTMPNVHGVWYYDFQDDGWAPQDVENNFGMVRPDGTPKPAYYAFGDVAAIAGESAFVARRDLGDDDVWALEFKHPSSGRVLAMWSASDAEATQVVLKPRTEQGDKTVRLQRVGRPAIERGWSHRDWAGVKDAPYEPGVISLVADASPTLIFLGEVDVTVERTTRRSRVPTTRATTVPGSATARATTKPADANAIDMLPPPAPRP